MVSFAIDRVTRCSSCFVGFFSARSSSIEEVEQREIFNLIKFQSRRYYYRSHSKRERESLNLIVKFLLHAIISELRPETIYNVSIPSSILRSQWFDTFFLSSLRILIYRIELINFQLKNKNLYIYIYIYISLYIYKSSFFLNTDLNARTASSHHPCIIVTRIFAAVLNLIRGRNRVENEEWEMGGRMMELMISHAKRVE